MTVTPPVERTVLFVVNAAYVVKLSDIINIINMMTPVILRLSRFMLIFLRLVLIELIFVRILEVFDFFEDDCEAFFKVLKSIHLAHLKS